MWNSNRSAAALFILISGIFLVGLVKLFLLRFAAGDVYREYSSLRADPLGTKGLYESLSAMDLRSVRRNFQKLSREQPWHDVTIFYLGMDARELEYASEDELTVLDDAVGAGGRIVITLRAETDCPSRCPGGGRACRMKEKGEGPQPETEDSDTQEGPSPSEGEAVAEEREEEEQKHEDCLGMRFSSLADHWGFSCEYDTDRKEKKDAFKAEGAFHEELPETVSWHTMLYFGELDEAWRVVYTCNGQPAIIARSFGKGSIVLSADTFLLSNEAMRDERYPHLLAWLVGPNAEVVFDETHLGVRKAPGVAVLARKYRLHWLFASLLLIAALFVWKNVVCFMPPRERDLSRSSLDASPKRDYAEGLISLLRRNIAGGQVLSVCIKEWERSLGSGKHVPEETVSQIRTVFADKPGESPQTRDPVREYQSICRMLTRKDRL